MRPSNLISWGFSLVLISCLNLEDENIPVQQRPDYLDVPINEYYWEQENCRIDDWGIGRITFDPTEDYTSKKHIKVYEDQDTTSTLKARFLAEEIEGDILLSVATLDVIESAILPNQNGWPVLELTSQWAQVVYGLDSSGVLYTGWVWLESSYVDVREWEEFFINRSIQFRRCIEPKFFDALNGSEVETSEYEKRVLHFHKYYLQPLQIVNDWMEVEFIVPPPLCNPDEEDEIKTLWIRYLAGENRSKIWLTNFTCP